MAVRAEGDLVARYGEEFVVVLPGCHKRMPPLLYRAYSAEDPRGRPCRAPLRRWRGSHRDHGIVASVARSDRDADRARADSALYRNQIKDVINGLINPETLPGKEKGMKRMMRNR